MSKPLVVSIPHHLGKDEAVRRLKSGLGRIRDNYSALFKVLEETWEGDQLTFRVSAVNQVAHGRLNVAEDHVQLEVMLPWLLAAMVEKIQPAIRRQGQLMLERKEPHP